MQCYLWFTIFPPLPITACHQTKIRVIQLGEKKLRIKVRISVGNAKYFPTHAPKMAR